MEMCVVDHPLAAARLTVLRDERTDTAGFRAALHELYAEVRRLTGRAPVVVDAGDLVTRPADTVRVYCARAGIGFRPSDQAALTAPADATAYPLGSGYLVAARSGCTVYR